ncbi:ribosome maturation factor RimM [Thiobacillus sp.]|uniref:ribosome maturation factor RimM n=1 Tax=Thiobacillus sp. TaxID=924 RepID=UPI0025D672D6|nr:ribosome maturation factor RimM [Thiobacillus sp.]
MARRCPTPSPVWSSRTSPPLPPELNQGSDWVVMGRIAAPFGIKGWVKVQPYSEAPDTLMDFESWRVGHGEQQMHYTVETIQDHGKALVAKLAGIDDRDAAYALRGQEISVAKSALPPPKENEFYWSDLIGLTVVNREGIELGKIDSLMESGANDLLVVKGAREHLIPFVAAFVGKVDLAGGTIEVDWGEDY